MDIRPKSNKSDYELLVTSRPTRTIATFRADQASIIF